MTLWLLTGGNLLFGDWGRPAQSAERKVSGAHLDQLATACEGHEPGSTNNEPAFAELIRNGHYLGYWSAKDEVLPDVVMKKIVKAMDYRQVYPRWLFLRDFPPSQFTKIHEDDFRRSGREAFSNNIVDFIQPHFPSNNDSIDRDCNIL